MYIAKVLTTVTYNIIIIINHRCLKANTTY